VGKWWESGGAYVVGLGKVFYYSLSSMSGTVTDTVSLISITILTNIKKGIVTQKDTFRHFLTLLRHIDSLCLKTIYYIRGAADENTSSLEVPYACGIYITGHFKKQDLSIQAQSATL